MSHSLQDMLAFQMQRNGGAALRASAFAEPYIAVERAVAGSFMTTVEKEHCSNCHIFFNHGGGYVMEAVPMHTDVMRQFADRGFRITAFHFPLSPEAKFEEMQEAIYVAYREICALYPEDTFVLFGDSAGAALNLELLIRLRDEGDCQRPTKSALISPGLDLSMCNPAIPAQQATDRTLVLPNCLDCARLYAGDDTDLKDPRISPMYADLSDLGSLALFFSGNELMRPDCELLAEKLKNVSGTSLISHMEPGLYHDYIMMVNSEPAQRAFQSIEEFFKG